MPSDARYLGVSVNTMASMAEDSSTHLKFKGALLKLFYIHDLGEI